MRCHWEKLGVLGPIYELVSEGLTDGEIADQLKMAEVTVHNCILWLMHFLKFHTRAELILYASPAQHGKWGLRAA